MELRQLASHKQRLAILGICSVPVTGLLLQKIWEKINPQKKTGKDELAKGPILPIASFWYLLSNHLCAVAVYHCTSLPLSLKLYTAFGLYGGGDGHVREFVQWYKGEHKPFFDHLDNGQPSALDRFIGMNILAGSLVGIYKFMYEWMKYNKKADESPLLKYGLFGYFLFTNVYEFHLQKKVKTSSVTWHYLHSFITHIGLSLMPPIIVWLYYPEIDIISLPWTVKYPNFSHKTK